MKLCQFVIFVIFQLLIFTTIEGAITDRSSKFAFPDHIIGSDASAADEVEAFARQYDHVDMGVDFLDDLVPLNFRLALANATLSNDDPMTNQFTPSHDGLSRLQRAVAKLYSPLIGQELNPEDNIVITVGATEALYSAFTGHTFPGDEWIIIEPAYAIYLPMVKMINGIVRVTSLKPANREDQLNGEDWVLDREELASLFNERTKGILLNNPLNPLGKVCTLDELQFIADLAIKHDTLVISDEAHEWVTFGKTHIRIGSLPGMYERTISIGSATKTFSLSGWRIGWAYGPKDIMSNLKAVHRTAVYWTATPQQVALASVFEYEIRNFGSPTSYFVSHREHVQNNRDLMVDAFKAAGLKPTIPDGGCCMLVDWSPLKNQLSDVQGATDFAKWLITNGKVMGLPANPYYSEKHQFMAENYLRFCYNKKYTNLLKAAESLKSLRNELQQCQISNYTLNATSCPTELH